MSTSAAQLDSSTLPLAAAQEWRPRFNPWLIAVTVTLATFMEVLDTSIANVALPHIAGSLSAGQDESTWVLTSYLVANAIILPMSGFFSSLIGRKRFYMSCVAMFTISSAACGFAPSLPWLIFFRILQGLGGGGLQPSEQSILADTFEPKKRGMAFAVYGMAVVSAPALGPTLGGWITDNFDWRWIFFINIPVGLLSIFLTSLVVEDPPHEREARMRSRKRQIDYIGFGLIALGLGALQIVLDKGERDDWFGSSFILWMTITSVVALLFAIFWELRARHPVVDLRLLKERNFAVANLLMFMLGFVLLGSTVMLPLFLQSLMGYTATQAGLALSPGGVVIILLLPFVGQALSRGVQAKYFVMAGLMISAIGLLIMGNFDLQISFRHAVWARIIQASGIAFLFVPINTIAYAYLPPGKNNDASGLVNLARNIGGSVGIAFATTMISRRAQLHQNFLAAHTSAYDLQFTATLASIKQALIAGGMSTVEAGQRAAAMVYATIQQQASLLSYVDVFRIMAFVFLAVIPFALLARRIQPGKVAVGH
jgi:DHA2 family multidrug resistance protein